MLFMLITALLLLLVLTMALLVSIPYAFSLSVGDVLLAIKSSTNENYEGLVQLMLDGKPNDI